MPDEPLTAAQLRDRAIRRLSTPRPTPEDVALADVWARLAISAAISETGTTPVTSANPT
jgi:hypothetical protein